MELIGNPSCVQDMYAGIEWFGDKKCCVSGGTRLVSAGTAVFIVLILLLL